MSDLTVAQLWCLGMLAVVAIAAITRRRRKADRPRLRIAAQKRDWRDAVYNPKQFRGKRRPPR